MGGTTSFGIATVDPTTDHCAVSPNSSMPQFFKKIKP